MLPEDTLPIGDAADEPLAEDTPPERTSAGIQSAEIALTVLSEMARTGGAHAVSELGRQLGMPRAKVHRYLVSLERMGFVEQDPASARYRLGSQALQVGLSALSDVDFVREGSNMLPKLAERLNESVFLSVWTDRGPVIVRWEDGGRPVTVNVRVGSAMPLLNSATGQACAAWMPEIQIVSLIDRELRGPGAGKAGLTDWLNCRARWQTVRHEGVARIAGTLINGIDSVAVPVLDAQGKLAGAITALGLSSVFDATLEGPASRLLREAGRALSLRLGYHGQAMTAGAAQPRRGRRAKVAPESA
ncbi:IclR family transcriptional regulator [Ralstonia flaminis]|jgi:DNA-binding IclR family transcriptional regulator|uniref:HTH-type transcriptional regulator XynR n=1 Tax=Ralstonia flaminis TaxID=3058597 RepID=A0ABM9K5A7_9RALS|nr:IclR family transcriptional regulator [Ralstonia sp. LMG 18101]CAJ0814344.1 HTH-type transcriptional regulator XynR [Ralstonia sp. LMG 18101]